MSINTLASQLREIIYGFAEHKDFSKEGNKVFKEKEKRLIEFSKAPESLSAALIVLENDTNEAVRFFTTMIIKDKFRYDFYTMDESVVSDAYARILNFIRNVPNPAKPVLSNLSLCLVYLYIHRIDSIGTIMNFFSHAFTTGSTVQ